MEKTRKCTRYKGELDSDGSLRHKRENRKKGDSPVCLGRERERDAGEELPRRENSEWTPSSLYKSER